MPVYEVRGNKNFYNLTDVIKWYMDYKRPLEVDTDGLTKEEADLKLVVAREKKLQLEIKEKERQLINIDEVDKSQSSLATLLVSQYKQLLLKLPILLQKKSKKDISKILDESFETNIYKLKEEAEKKYDD